MNECHPMTMTMTYYGDHTYPHMHLHIYPQLTLTLIILQNGKCQNLSEGSPGMNMKAAPLTNDITKVF